MRSAINLEAIRRGGVALALPCGTREELRITVRIDGGRRRYDARIWFRGDAGAWLPSRRGWNGLSGADVRTLGAALLAVGAAAPSRGRLAFVARGAR